MGETLTTLDKKLEKEELMFNQTIRQFNIACNATASVSRNATKFKALIGATVARYIPFYQTAMEQVTTTIKTTKAVAALIGQEELTTKLEQLNQTAVEKLGAMADFSQDLATKVANTGVVQRHLGRREGQAEDRRFNCRQLQRKLLRKFGVGHGHLRGTTADGGGRESAEGHHGDQDAGQKHADRFDKVHCDREGWLDQCRRWCRRPARYRRQEWLFWQNLRWVVPLISLQLMTSDAQMVCIRKL
eukprot:Skav216358  [mRNA]  locus=scaffold3700:16586:17320:+ [translate_table: standard]